MKSQGRENGKRKRKEKSNGNSFWMSLTWNDLEMWIVINFLKVLTAPGQNVFKFIHFVGFFVIARKKNKTKVFSLSNEKLQPRSKDNNSLCQFAVT